MDICPRALFESLKSDLYRGLSTSEIDHIESDVTWTRFADPQLVARSMLLKSFLKKFEGDGRTRKAADRRAYDLFLQWNQRCKDWVEPEPSCDVERICLGEFKLAFMQCFETHDGDVIDFRTEVPVFMRPGPGAAVDAKMTDAYTKMYAGSLSTTSEDLYWEYYNSTLSFELEQQAEVKRSACFETPIVRGSITGFAPKNRDISRTTCTEANLNMIYQLGAGAVIENIVRCCFNVDLSTQPDLNREMSRLGSISGRFGTTDLTSASDATSLGLWNWAMPYKEIHNFFMWIRSAETKSPFSDEWVRLHMLSSMGNGFTFPLMTLLFLCVVKAAYRTLGIPMIYNRVQRDGSTKPGNFGVFGDDIIVVSEAFNLVNRTLELLGYAVNTDKSFNKGPFRESCGTDWHLGQNVRGVYCKRLAQPHRRYSLINRLNAWSSEWDIPLPSAIGYLLKTVWFAPIPPWENADAGIVVPFDDFHFKPKVDVNGSYIYSAYRPVKVTWEPMRGLTDQHDSPGGEREPGAEFVNEFGVILATVRGYLRDGLVNCRDDNAKYHKTRLTTPGWAFTGRSTCGFSRLGWERFEKIISKLNLGR